MTTRYSYAYIIPIRWNVIMEDTAGRSFAPGYSRRNLSREIREILADEYSVNILRVSLDGFVASTDSYKTMGMTKKQYYPRLQRLIELGFIEKITPATGKRKLYAATSLGKMIFKTQVSMVEEIAENIDGIEAVNALKQAAGGMTEEKINEISKMLLGGTSILRDVLAGVHDLEVISEYESVISKSGELISNAKAHVIVASRHVHPDSVRAMMQASAHDVQVSTVVEKAVLSKRLSDLKIDSIAKLEANASLIFPAKSSNIKVRYAHVDYTFMVVDGLVSLIEVLSPYDQGFLMALKFSSRDMIEKMTGIFSRMWFNASDPMKTATSIIRLTPKPKAN
jgi:DNA-binding HxlR family transcriptional regulator